MVNKFKAEKKHLLVPGLFKIHHVSIYLFILILFHYVEESISYFLTRFNYVYVKELLQVIFAKRYLSKQYFGYFYDENKFRNNKSRRLKMSCVYGWTIGCNMEKDS